MEVIIHRAHQHQLQLIGSVVLPPYLLFFILRFKSFTSNFPITAFHLFLVFSEIGYLLVIVDQLTVEV